MGSARQNLSQGRCWNGRAGNTTSTSGLSPSDKLYTLANLPKIFAEPSPVGSSCDAATFCHTNAPSIKSQHVAHWWALLGGHHRWITKCARYPVISSDDVTVHTPSRPVAPIVTHLPARCLAAGACYPEGDFLPRSHLCVAMEVLPFGLLKQVAEWM